MVTKAQAEKAAEQPAEPADDTPAITDTIHYRMGKVLAELPAIGKGQQAPSAIGGYAFRGIEDVLNALNPLLSKWGIFIMPEVLNVSHLPDRGKEHVTEVVVAYEFFGPMGDSVRAVGCGEGSDTRDKGTQKAMTSAFKYVLFQAFAINTQDAGQSDVDRSAPAEDAPVLTPQQQRKAEFDAAGQPLPEGWATFEEFDDAHQTILAGVKGLAEEQQASLRSFRTEAGIPWPMSTTQMDAFIEKVAEVTASA